MRRVGTLLWLLAAGFLSGVSATTPAVTSSGLAVTADNSDPWTTAAAQTTTVTTTAVESTETDDVANIGDGRFCNQMISYTLKTDCKPCPMNAELGCPDGLVQLTEVLSRIL